MSTGLALNEDLHKVGSFRDAVSRERRMRWQCEIRTAALRCTRVSQCLPVCRLKISVLCFGFLWASAGRPWGDSSQS